MVDAFSRSGSGKIVQQKNPSQSPGRGCLASRVMQGSGGFPQHPVGFYLMIEGV